MMCPGGRQTNAGALSRPYQKGLRMDDQDALRAVALFTNRFERSRLLPAGVESGMEIAWGVTHLGSLLALMAVPTLLAGHAWETPWGAFALTACTGMAMRSYLGFLRARRR